MSFQDPIVELLLPAAGPRLGGTLVVVRGPGFAAGSDYRCKFGSHVVRAQPAGDGGNLTCVSPRVDAASPVSVEVSMNGQQYSSSGVEYTYLSAVVISSVWPLAGASEGGTPVTLTGSGFSSAAEAAGQMWCRFNATVSRAAYVSETEAVCNTTQ